MVFFTSNYISDEAIGQYPVLLNICPFGFFTRRIVLLGGDAGRVWGFLLAEHALLLLKIVIQAAVDDVPQVRVNIHWTLFSMY